MKKTRIISMFLVFILALTVMFPLFASAEDPTIVDSGYCGGEGDGTNLTWSLDSEGVLTISGSGAMFEKSCISEGNYSPWFSKRNRIKKVIFEPGVTHVGNGFFQCEKLETIEIPETVESMSNYVFPYCFSLKEVTIPKSLTYIRDNPFIFCKKLTKITVDEDNPVYLSKGNCVIEKESGKLTFGCTGSVIPDDGTVKSIAYTAFDGAGFSQITIPSSLTTVDGFSCSDLESVIIQDGVTEIASHAFYQCRSLKSVTIPESLTTIGDSAFLLTAVETVDYGGTREQWDQIVVGTNNEQLLNADIRFLGCSHIPGEPKEDPDSRIPLTCTDDGTVDIVTECTLCGKELSRETVLLPATNHKNAVTVPQVEATYDAHGFTEGVFCNDCNTWLSGHEIIHNTLGERTIVREATEDKPGEVIITCTVCGERGLYEYQYQHKPEEPSDDNPTIGERIRKAVRGVIDWFLRLIAWLGGGKK